LNLSSIFSSDTLKASFWPTRAVIIVIIACAIIRLGMLYYSDSLMQYSDDLFIDIIRNVINQYDTVKNPHPKVLFLGSSRVYDLKEKQIAENLNLPTDDVMIYGTPGNDFWRTATILRLKPEMVRDAKVVIIDIFPYQIYTGAMSLHGLQTFCEFATFEERLIIKDPTMKIKSLCDQIFPIYSRRKSLVNWTCLYLGIQTIKYRKLLPIRPLTPEDQMVLNPDMHFQITLFAPEPEISLLELHSLKKIRALIPKKCKIVLCFLPVPRELRHVAMKITNFQKSYRLFKDYMMSTQDNGFEVYWFDDQDDFGLVDSDYRDIIGHLTNSGAIKASDKFSKIIGTILEANTTEPKDR